MSQRRWKDAPWSFRPHGAEINKVVDAIGEILGSRTEALSLRGLYMAWIKGSVEVLTEHATYSELKDLDRYLEDEHNLSSGDRQRVIKLLKYSI